MYDTWLAKHRLPSAHGSNCIAAVCTDQSDPAAGMTMPFLPSGNLAAGFPPPDLANDNRMND
eukprot:12938137-Prorocentrum_lima.AAC.1